MKTRVFLLFSFVFACSSAYQETPHRNTDFGDIAFVGAKVITMDPATKSTTADTIIVRKGKIVFLGKYSEGKRFIGKETKVLQLKGKTIIPGLVDGHAHLYGLGIALESVNLRGSKSEKEAVERIQKAAAMRPTGEWITGRGWDQNLWKEQSFPTLELLDKAIPNHPVVVRRVDGHAVWANSTALKMSGIDLHTQSPKGGKILRDSGGKATGVLLDTAMGLVEKHVPEPNDEVVVRRILKGAEKAISLGLTGVHEMGISPRVIEIYKSIQERLPLRVYGFMSGTKERIEGKPSKTRHPFFEVRSVKFFADGALGSRGATLVEPYTDDPGNKGNWIIDASELKKIVKLAVKNGWQVGIHAIGDAANKAVLDAYGEVDASNNRLRIEHAQVLAKEDIPRFSKMGIIASMQPVHATSDMPWAEKRVGPERIKGAYAWRSLLDSGVRIVGGSDFPVEKVSPLDGLYAAISRQDKKGSPTGGWYPNQRMTLYEALRSFTVEPAYASFREQEAGMIKVGYYADFTILDGIISEQRILELDVKYTVVDGKIVYQSTN